MTDKRRLCGKVAAFILAGTTIATFGLTNAASAQADASSTGDATMTFGFEVENVVFGSLTPADFSTTLIDTLSETELGTFSEGDSVTVPLGEYQFSHPLVDGYEPPTLRCLADVDSPVPLASPNTIELRTPGDVTCTLTYVETESPFVSIVSAVGTDPDDSTNAPFEHPALESIITVVNGIEYSLETTPEDFVPGINAIRVGSHLDVAFPLGQVSIEPLGTEGLELYDTFCGLDDIDGANLYEATSVRRYSCLFLYQPIEEPPVTTTTAAPTTTTTAAPATTTTAAPTTTTTSAAPAVGAVTDTTAEPPVLAFTGPDSDWIALTGAITLASGLVIETTRRRRNGLDVEASDSSSST